MGEAASSESLQTRVEERNLLHLRLIFVFGIFATTLPQPQALGRLPLQFLLKNDVGVTREQMAAFFFWCGLARYLKPFAGILTMDAGYPYRLAVWLLFLAGRTRPYGPRGASHTQRARRSWLLADAFCPQCRPVRRRRSRLVLSRPQMAIQEPRVPQHRNYGDRVAPAALAACRTDTLQGRVARERIDTPLRTWSGECCIDNW